ncbi:MAG: zinc ABC transporter substrate-binding protein [Deltaproteobacteria bacterium]|nr:zinc ABC transporter substrate-binding protein [Deltaproteobacteria bacterium]
MKKIFLTALILLLPLTTSAKLKIVTTIPDLAELVRKVGGDAVEVKSLARGDQDPHYLEPKPSYTVLLNQADLLIEVGLELEIGWLPVLLTQSRNPKMQLGQPGHLIASDHLRILEIPTGPIDRSMGDVHPMGNPHYWMNPKNGLIIAKNIADRLGRLDPTHATTYAENFKTWESSFSKRITQWEKELASVRGRTVITHHKSFSYFVDWADLKVEGLIEPKPGIPPTPSHILYLIDLIKTERIPLIITENYYDPKPARELSEKTGSKFLVLPTSVGGDSGVDSYEGLFQFLIEKMKGAL